MDISTSLVYASPKLARRYLVSLRDAQKSRLGEIPEADVDEDDLQSIRLAAPAPFYFPNHLENKEVIPSFLPTNWQ